MGARGLGSKVIAGGLKLVVLGGLGSAFAHFGPDIADYVSGAFQLSSNPDSLTWIGDVANFCTTQGSKYLTYGLGLGACVKGTQYSGKVIDPLFNNDQPRGGQ